MEQHIEKFYKMNFHCIPVRPKGKIPIPRDWTNAQYTEKQIKEFFNLNQEMNLGILTGRISELLVLDIDGEEGKQSLSDLLGSTKLDTFTVSTGKGVHYYFKTNKDFRNSAGKIANGIDIRSRGGFIVAPPSIHVNGNQYRIVNDRELADLPGWLESLIYASYDKKKERERNAKTDKKRPKRTYKNTDSEDIPEGKRNDTLFDEGWKFRKQGHTEKGAIEKLLSMNLERCKPPLRKDEVEKIASQVYNYKKDEEYIIKRINSPVVLTPKFLEWILQSFDKKEQQKAITLYTHMFMVSTWGDDYQRIAHYRDFFSDLMGIGEKYLRNIFNKFEEKGIFHIETERLESGKNFDTKFWVFTWEDFKT